jgi:polyhydroxyalkanoate synthase subunit PhaC
LPDVSDPPIPDADGFSQAGQTWMQGWLAWIAAQGGEAQAAALAELSARAAALQADYSQQHLSLWSRMLARESGQPYEPLVAPERGDRRFAAAEWRDNPYYDYLKQAYLINAGFLTRLTEATTLDERSKERLRFFTRQYIDALAPSNFAATNPEALKLAMESQGETLTRGIQNLMQDVEKGRISMTDESVFEIGRNIATTKGDVVFENELIQLIQYKPLTKTVASRPLVMVPPCINKFYILDLQPENSFVRYAVEQGNTVFMVSWRQITAELGRLTWDDYVEKGVLAAIDVARKISGAPEVNTLGFCVGGTLLGSALAVKAARGERDVASLTLLATMLDFSDPGDIGLFIDENTVAMREQALAQGGVMPGRDLAFAFSSLRANDLIWSYVVNNYLKGKTPDAFDLLYWNSDGTNLPGPMYCWYIRNMYLENKLREPGKLTMCGVPVDLGRIKAPSYVLATREDHIVPWKTAYGSTGLLGGKTRFVLGESGHIAGVINPAKKNRRSYWLDERRAADPERWLKDAREVPGSWWPDWDAWLKQFAGGEKAAPKKTGGKGYKAIEPAPGRYVKERA